MPWIARVLLSADRNGRRHGRELRLQIYRLTGQAQNAGAKVGSVFFIGQRFGMLRSLCSVAFVLVFTDVLSGCAVYNMYEKCGFHGCSGDAKISAAILARFRQHSELEPNAINVQTLDHMVYLYGVVSSSLEIDTAESIARKVSGVQGVVNSVVAQTR